MTDKMKKIYGDIDTSSLNIERVDITQNPEILEKILEFYIISKEFKEFDLLTSRSAFVIFPTRFLYSHCVPSFFSTKSDLFKNALS